MEKQETDSKQKIIQYLQKENEELKEENVRLSMELLLTKDSFDKKYVDADKLVRSTKEAQEKFNSAREKYIEAKKKYEELYKQLKSQSVDYKKQMNAFMKKLNKTKIDKIK